MTVTKSTLIILSTLGQSQLNGNMESGGAGGFTSSPYQVSDKRGSLTERIPPQLGKSSLDRSTFMRKSPSQDSHSRISGAATGTVNEIRNYETKSPNAINSVTQTMERVRISANFPTTKKKLSAKDNDDLRDFLRP